LWFFVFYGSFGHLLDILSRFPRLAKTSLAPRFGELGNRRDKLKVGPIFIGSDDFAPIFRANSRTGGDLIE